MALVRAGKFQFAIDLHHRCPQSTSMLFHFHLDRRWAHCLWSMPFFWHHSQIDHLRPSDALAQIRLDARHDVQIVAPASNICSLQGKCLVSVVCESEKSEVKACLYVPHRGRRTRGFSGGSIDQLCRITFPSETTRPKQSVNLSELGRSA